MIDFRRIIVILVIAVLLGILTQVSIDAVYPEPKYDAYCRPTVDAQLANMPKPVRQDFACTNYTPSAELSTTCTPEKGQVQFKYDTNGCVTQAYCETCYKNLEIANEKRGLAVFIVSAILGLIATVIGLYLQPAKNPINEWVGSGFLLGGLISIFVGTVRYFGNMGRFMKPIIILLELILVIWLAYKKLGKK